MNRRTENPYFHLKVLGGKNLSFNRVFQGNKKKNIAGEATNILTGTISYLTLEKNELKMKKIIIEKNVV